MAKEFYGAIEFGGTKTVALIAQDEANILNKRVFPTLEPLQTIQTIADYFKNYQNKNKLHIQKIGVGCFGPLDLKANSKTYGSITSTPKKGWGNFHVKDHIEEALGVTTYIDTDVNAAAIGEHSFGSNDHEKNLAYITVGTGIGAGFIINNRIVHGLVHPEFGHMRIPHDINIDPFPGICPFHNDCLEGLASGPAMEARWRTQPQSLPKDHAAWHLEAEYLSLGLVNLICTVSPELIILGGGVMNNELLFNFIHLRTKQLLNHYINSNFLAEKIAEYIIPPRLNDNSGILGALWLAMNH